jgi:hypothetical protein
MTRVIFRKWRDTGEIIALFPEIKSSRGMCESYMQIGQHGGADYSYLVAGWYGPTVPATPEEYADLLAELEDIGYDDLLIRKKRRTEHRRI